MPFATPPAGKPRLLLFDSAGLLADALKFVSRLVRCPLDFGEIDAFLHHFVKRRKLAQMLDDVDDLGGYVVHFSLCVETAEAEPD
jgi:hypothetical protein